MTLDSSAASSRRSVGWIVAINVVIAVVLVGGIELAARGLIRLLRGTATAGLHERMVYLEYEPFVMYGPGWAARFASEPSGGGMPTVLLLGGSTAQGFEPRILEEALAARFNRAVRVVNGAFGGYEARQEAIVAALWAPRIAPAVIVSLDAHNDLEHRLRVPAPGRFFLDETYRTYLTRPVLAPFAWLFANSQAYAGLVRLRARRQVGEWSAYADAIPVYIDAQRSLNMLARGLGAKRLMVMQPFVAFKQPLASEEREFTAYAYREPVMRALYDRTAAELAELSQRDGVGFLDARSIYNGMPEALFRDDVHFRGVRGYEILARAIAGGLSPDALMTTAK